MIDVLQDILADNEQIIHSIRVNGDLIATPPVAKSILILLAHPDDETFIGGSIKHLVDNGHNVHVMYSTSGKYGSDVTGVITDPDELGQAREMEAVLGLAELGVPVENVHALREDDDSENEVVLLQAMTANLDSGTFVPEVIITFTYTGVYGHADHIEIGRVGTQYYRQTDTCESIFYFDYPLSDRIRSIAPNEGGDITYNHDTQESHGVNDCDIAYTHALTATELQARKDGITKYPTQFDATTIGYHQGHIDYRPFEYFMIGTTKSGGAVNPTYALRNLFKGVV